MGRDVTVLDPFSSDLTEVERRPILIGSLLIPAILAVVRLRMRALSLRAERRPRSAACNGSGVARCHAHWQVTEDAHAREATRVSGTVLGRLDDGYALRVRLGTPGAGVRKLETFDASGYPVGSSVHVLIDRSWARLAAEPFDPTGWYMLAAGSALFGTTLVITVLVWRRRLAALSTGPVPALTRMGRTRP